MSLLRNIINILLSMWVLFYSHTQLNANDQVLALYSASGFTEPVFNQAEVAVETARFNNWLNANHKNIKQETIPALQEHLYYLIDSHIKHTYLENAFVHPKETDLILRILFSWSEVLQTYGGIQVHNSIVEQEVEQLPTSNTPPYSFSLSFKDGLYTVRSTTGNWQIKVPLNFMIGRMQHFVAENGEDTQLLIISTGAAKHSDRDGHSQATIMVIFSPQVDSSTFSSFWRNAIGLNEENLVTSPELDEYTHFIGYDSVAKIHKEYVERQLPSGSMGIFYSGLSGPYEQNRDHFIDFLSTISENK